MLTLLALVAVQTAPPMPLPLERVFAEPPLAGKPPVQPMLSPGGRYATFLKASADSTEVLDLWAKPLPDGKERLLVAASALTGGKAQKLTEAERMALERKRISQRGITSVLWCGSSDTRLIFPFSGDLVLVTLSPSDDVPPKVTRLTKDDAVPEQNPICDPTGSFVAYVKKGNVVVHDLKTNVAKPLTKGASKTVSYGLAEFIAEEELGRHDGMWWSKDGNRMLVLEVDESKVGVKVRPQIFADRTELVSQRYPAAGEKNATVKAHLYDRRSSAKTTLLLPKDVEYIARAGFLKDGRAWMQTLTRDQRKLSLLVEDKPKGKLKALLVEEDQAWVEVHDTLRELPKGGLLWSSEASGRNQLVQVDLTTGARTPLTDVKEAVDTVVCIQEDGSIVFSGYAARGRAHHLYVRAPDGAVRALTNGESWHTARGDSKCQNLVVTSSSWGTPSVTTLRAVSDGSVVFTFGSDTDKPDALLKLAKVNDGRFIDVKAADGQTTLNALWLPPAGKHDGETVPVITYAYGGPTGQVVAYRWARQYPLFVHWQQQGYGVFLVDTRGMAGRDRDFSRAHKDAFGKVEVDDLKAAARQLPSIVRGVDKDKIAFVGWSYGGYLAARLMLDDDTPYAAAAAVAPVTDWRLYDTAYTERYIGVPGDTGDAPTYASSHLPSRASLLKKPLLLVHGTADDNVLFEHTLRLVQALEDEGKVFDLAIYPGKAHGISGNASQLHVWKTITTFFQRTVPKMKR